VAAIFGSSSSNNSKKYKMSKVTFLLLLVLTTAWLEVNEAAASSCPVWQDLDEAVSSYIKELFGNSVVGGECNILMKNRRRR
jgi:hypothetical protein